MSNLENEAEERAAEAVAEIRTRKGVKGLLKALKGAKGAPPDSTESICLQRRAAAALSELAAEDPEEIQRNKFILSTAEKRLAKELVHEDALVRKNIAMALDMLGWIPSEDKEKALFLIAAEKWNDLPAVGRPAVKPLLSILKDKDLTSRCDAARALGEIGDKAALRPLLASPNGLQPDAYVTLSQPIAEALKAITDASPEPLIRLLTEWRRDLLGGIPLVWNICEIGDKTGAGPVIDWLFKVHDHDSYYRPTGNDNWEISNSFFSCRGHTYAQPNIEFISEVIPAGVLEKLLGAYTAYIHGVFSWIPTEKFCQLEKDDYAAFIQQHDEIEWDLSTCNEAIVGICSLETRISSNILHRVAALRNVRLSVSRTLVGGEMNYHFGHLGFKAQSRIAQEELKRRGNPPYNADAYLEDDEWIV